jgi:GntR family transcriptional regulator, galactonate operon transcriptional repressor
MERVYQRILSDLLDDIVAGAIPLGATLPKAGDIAGRHACSIGAAREAIRALEERRVIAVRAGRGQTLLGPDEWNLLDREICEATLLRRRDPGLLREAVEALTRYETQGVLVAVPRVTNGDLTLLEQTLDRMRELARGANGTRDPAERFAEEEAKFHRSLMVTSGNRFMASALEALHSTLALTRSRHAPERDPAVIRAHETLMAGLAERDVSAVAAAIERYGRQLLTWLRV